MYMKCKDGIWDFDIYHLKDRLIELDAKLLELVCQIQEARKNSLDPDALGLFDGGEYIIGEGFAACQRYITSTFGPTGVKKETALKIGPNHENGESIATIINAAANYWKHRDEWREISFVIEPESDMAIVIIRDFNNLTSPQKKPSHRLKL